MKLFRRIAIAFALLTPAVAFATSSDSCCIGGCCLQGCPLCPGFHS